MESTAPKARNLIPAPVDTPRGTFVAIRDPLGLVPDGLAISPALYSILSHCDGQRTAEEIQAEMVLAAGRFVSLAEIENALRELEDLLLLDGGRAGAALAERIASYRAGPRPATHAGTVYPGDPDALREALRSSTSAETSLPDGIDLRAIVAPHIDFARGGEVYSTAYSAAAARLVADTFVVLGVMHFAATAPFVPTAQAFDTPLGTMEVDDEALAVVTEALGETAAEDELLHIGEHSVEFQVAHLKHLFPEARIVPILCGHVEPDDEEAMARADSLAAAIRRLLDDPSKRCAVVAGVDLSHVGPDFGHSEAVDGTVRAWAEGVDREVLRSAVTGNAPGVLVAAARQTESGEDANVCGQSALYVLARALAPCFGSVLRYAQAPTPSGDSLVGFAAAAFWRREEGSDG